MLQRLINSFRRKIARRITRHYPTRIDNFHLQNYGEIKFANWNNPLVASKDITEDQIKFFRKFLKVGDTAIDIGANMGHMTIPMSLITGKQGLVLAFDPNPMVFEILIENAKLNSELTQIHAFNYAISEEDDEFYYHSSEASFNNGGISKEKHSRHGKYALATKIKGINLEKFLSTNYAEAAARIRLIKIDTEGYDKEIIKSIGTLLTKYKPAVITECFGKNTKEERFEQFDLLKSKGYSLFFVSDFVENAEIIPIEEKEDMLKWKHFDLYAVMG